jgi:hypothetical protein
MSTPSQIAETIHANGHDVILLHNEVLIAPFCGRVLAVGPAGGENAIWTNPAFEAGDTTEALLSGEGWLNHGGDRIWVSPEMETHVEDPARMFETYAVAPEVDPGSYVVTSQDDDAVTIRSTGAPLFKQSSRRVDLDWEQRIACMHRPAELNDTVAFAGYRTSTTLRASDFAPTQPALWRLLQVPGGGTITVTTKPGTSPLTLFGKPALTETDDGLTCKVDTDEFYKFAIDHRDATGVMRYRRDGDTESDLIIRKFTTVPGAVYSDVPNFDLEKRGYVVQIYVDDGGFGGFGELEHHSPALHGDKTEVIDICETEVYRGPASEIDRLCQPQA